MNVGNVSEISISLKTDVACLDSIKVKTCKGNEREGCSTRLNLDTEEMLSLLKNSCEDQVLPRCVRIDPAAEERIINQWIVETEIKYEGYISKAMDQVEKWSWNEFLRILTGILTATEARQKFSVNQKRLVKQVVSTGVIQRISLF